MARKKAQLEIISRHGRPAQPSGAPPTVSGRWIMTALGVVLAIALVCAWGSFCLLFWQGAWQLLYHPSSRVARTPAAVGLGFEPVGFAATEAGAPRLRGWWIPAADSGAARFTVLYLHGRTGNLGDCVDKLAAIHAAGVNILAFDYRGYGQSDFVHPSEKHWREDAEWALEYMTGTRQIAAKQIVVAGSGLGANLALEMAAAHAELGGVVLDGPLNAPADLVFSDARAKLVPARLLFRDRYALRQPAANLRVPSLWILGAEPASAASEEGLGAAYEAAPAPKTLVRTAGTDETAAIRNWLVGLHGD